MTTTYSYTPTFKSGEFHHAVLSISGTTHTLYLDGSAVLTTSGATDILATLTNVNQSIIGANSAFNQAFNGIIGDVRVYNQVITAKQVSNLYLNRNLIAHYPFDNSVNNLTPNYATLQYDATIVGSVNLTSGLMGTSQLQLTNTIGNTASQYVIASPGSSSGSSTTNPWYLNSTTGLTISCWVNLDSTANTNNIMRIFDMPFVSGTRGLGVDISGTNAIYSRLTTPIPPINLLSSAAYNSMINTGTNYNSTDKKYDGTRLQAGAYGLKLLVSKWMGKPVIQLKRTTDTSSTDFYAPNDGTTNLTNGAGQTLVTWLGASTGYVTKWYDQTGNGNHGTATADMTTPTFESYPFINTTKYVVDFSNNGCFDLPDGAYPYGNSPYTYLFKQGRLPYSYSQSIYNFVYSGGTDSNGNSNYAENVYVYGNVYDDYWTDNHYYGMTAVENAVVAFTYGGDNYAGTSSSTGKLSYINNIPYLNGSYANMNDQYRAQTQNYNRLGRGPSVSNRATYNSTMPYFIWMPYKLGASDIAILGRTTA